MKGLISLVVFVAVGVIAWWLVIGENENNNLLQQAKTSRYVEVFMNDFEVTAMNENGKPAYILNGNYLERYNDSDETRIEQPVFQLLESGKQWRVSAEYALINDKSDTIDLKTNVVMMQQNIEPAITIRTQSMQFHTKTQIAQTRALVEITQGKSQLSSNGMIYNNITSELELSSGVSGFYLPYD